MGKGKNHSGIPSIFVTRKQRNMQGNEDIAQKIAEHLLQIKAVKLSPNQPFTWTSGIKSPIYCDNRVTLSYPTLRTYIRQAFVSLIQEHFGQVDLIAGVATGGIAQGALVAQDLGLPMVYVRTSQKQHGLENLIEGVVKEGQSVVVIEDLVSTGKSSLVVVEALREAGCVVKGMVAIFTYGLKIAETKFQEAKCSLVTLTDYDVLIREALDSDYISQPELESLIRWRENPEGWMTR